MFTLHIHRVGNRGYLRAGTKGRASAERLFPRRFSGGATIGIGRLTFERGAGAGFTGLIFRGLTGGIRGVSTHDNSSRRLRLTCSVIQETLGALGFGDFRKRGDFPGVVIINWK